MPTYEVEIGGSKYNFDAPTDEAAGKLIDAQKGRIENNQKPTAGGFQRAVSGEVPVSGPDPAMGPVMANLMGDEGPEKQARERGRSEGLLAGQRTGGGVASTLSGVATGAGRNWQDETAAYGAVSGLPEALSAVPGVGLARAAVGAAREAAGVPAGNYAAELERIRGNYEGLREANPKSTLVGEIGGGAVASIPSMALGPVGGAIEGAVAGAGAGEDTSSRLVGAGVGGAVGAALPIVGNRVLKPVYEAGKASLVNRGFFGGAAREAEKQTARALSRDWEQMAPDAGLSSMYPPTGQAEVQTLGDMGGETTRALARKVANESPEARQAIAETTQDRFLGQGQRVENWWNRATGAPDAVVRRGQLEEAARAANRPAYDAAYEAGQSVYSPQLETLTSAPTIRDAIRSVTRTSADAAALRGQRVAVKNPFTEAPDGTLTLPEGQTPSLEFWDHVQRNLRRAEEAAPRGGDEARMIGQFRRQLNEQLDAAVPEFRTARQGAAAAFGQEDALEAGRTFLNNPRASSTEARQAFARMSQPEQDLFREGVEEDVRNTVRALPDARDIGKLFQNPETRSRLQMSFGNERAQELQDVLRIERGMNDLKNAVQGNSSSVRQLIESGILGASGGSLAADQAGFDPTSGGGAGAAIGAGLSVIASRQNSRLNAEVARRIGTMLSSSDPDDWMGVVRAMNNTPTLRRTVSEFLERLGAATVTAVPAQQAGSYTARPQ